MLDTSAVLALLWAERGADRVAGVLSGARISTVNLAELIGKLIDRGATDQDAVQIVENLGVAVVGFDPDQAVATGFLRRTTRDLGLSIGDRACLALALREGAPALTADQAWAGLDLGIAVELIR